MAGASYSHRWQRRCGGVGKARVGSATLGADVLPAERSEDLTALSERVRTPSSDERAAVRPDGRVRPLHRISAQIFTALIPLFIVVASAAPAGQEDVISQAIIDRFALTGDTAAAVDQLFTTPPGATSEVTLFSAFAALLRRRLHPAPAADVPSGVGAGEGRRPQHLLRHPRPARPGLSRWSSPTGSAASSAASRSSGSGRSRSRWPSAWCSGRRSPTSSWTGRCTGDGCWRRRHVGPGTTVFSIATPIYMPELMTRATNEFGLFGITITIIGWLLVASFILVAQPRSEPSSTPPTRAG